MPEGIQVTIETTRPAAPPVSKTTDKRIPALDGLRAISILFVLFNHLVGHDTSPRALLPWDNSVTSACGFSS
jgi:hypothetical protein